MSDGPAMRYARSRTAWAPIDWWKLEARALQAFPAVRRALAFFSPPEAWRGLSRGVPTGWGCLLTIAHIASFTLPVLAGAAMVGWLFDASGEAPVGTAGMLAGIAAVVAAVGMVNDRHDPVGSDPKAGRMLGALHLVPSAIGTAIAAVAIAQGGASGALGIVGLLADAVVGAIQLVLVRGPADDGSARWHRNVARLTRALDAVPLEERVRIAADLQEALEELYTRGIVPEDAYVRARDVRVGSLGMTMAPRGIPSNMSLG